MNTIQKIEAWGDKHHPKWLDILRIILGLVILAKGYYFVTDTDGLKQIIASSRFGQVSFVLEHYVVFAHLIGGALIVVGLITRIAVMAQLPILIGAVLLVNSRSGFFSSNSTELWLSIIILFLLIFFLIEGSGPWSVDEYMRKHPEKDDWEDELSKGLPMDKKG
ncbi:MAG TPA: DoxX family protein [Chitinophagales bacterium]|nr:DoxX family protein [Chitinophagales bacterium]